MQTSIFIAQILGPLFLAIGAGLLVNREGDREVAEEFLDSRPLIYLAGLLALVPGLAIVLTHNLWAFDWRLIVTIFGWLAVIGGAFGAARPGNPYGVSNGLPGLAASTAPALRALAGRCGPVMTREADSRSTVSFQAGVLP